MGKRSFDLHRSQHPRGRTDSDKELQTILKIVHGDSDDPGQDLEIILKFSLTI